MARFLAAHQDSKDKLMIAVCKTVKDAMREFKQHHGNIPLFAFFNLNHLLAMTDEQNPVLSDAIVIDTETTGLSPLDGAEILQLSIINQDGEILFNEYFKPMFAESWEIAMQINHITPEMVAEKPHIYERMQEIYAILPAWRFYPSDLVILLVGGGICVIMIMRERKKAKEELE